MRKKRILYLVLASITALSTMVFTPTAISANNDYAITVAVDNMAVGVPEELPWFINNGYIDVLPENQKISSIKSDFINNAIFKSSSGDLLNDNDLLTTGSIIRHNETDYVVIIKGDINSDGKVDSKDYLMVKRAYLGTFTLMQTQLMAACISGGAQPQAKDYLMVKRHYLGSYDLHAEAKAIRDYDYKLVNSGKSVVITGYKGNNTNIKIPEKIVNKPVVAIDSYAFKNSQITSVVIPDSVLQLNEYAFSDASHLITITIGKGITLFRRGVFRYCSALTDMYIKGRVSFEPDFGNYDISALSGIPFSMTIHTEMNTPIWGNKSYADSGGRQFYNFVSTGECKDEHVFSYRFINDYSEMEICNYYRNTGNGNSPSLILPSSFGEYAVTSIGAFALYNSTVQKLYTFNDTLVIPETITNMDGTALVDTKFKYITIPDNVICENLFINNINLLELNLGSGVKSIEYFACPKLKSLIIPDSVTSLGEGAFTECPALTSVVLSQNLEKIPMNCFKDCSGISSITIPSSVIDIGGYAFYGTSITELVIPSSVKSVGAEFTGKNCTNITLNDGLETIRQGAFRNSSITSITIPSTVTSIGIEAFRNCTKLKSVSILCQAERLPDNCFYNCTALETVTIGSLIKTIGKFSFSDCINLETINFNEGLETIEENAFTNCKKLKSVVLPSSMRRLEGAFSHCTALTSLTLNEGLTYIAQNTLAYCTSLTSITIPSTVINPPTVFPNWSGTIIE